jgi:acyl-CoA thioester hydrolase
MSPSVTRTFESEALIRFPDCDPFNHLNNARYLDYFMNAREDHLSRYMDFDLYRLARDERLAWVVTINRIAYLKPAMLMETVVIDSTILEWRERDLVVEMRMWDQSKARLKALLWSTFAHVDLRTGKAIPHSADLSARFRPLEAPLPDPSTTFERRLAAVRARPEPPAPV